MGRTLRRYLRREIRLLFIGGLAGSTFVLAIMRIMELVDLAFARGVPAKQVAALFAYMLPSYLELTVPMALLIALVLAFSRMSRDGEVIAIQTSGISLGQIVRPLFTVSAGVALLSLILSVYLRPWASRRVDTTVAEMAETRFTAALTPGVFSPWLDGVVVYVGELDRDNGLLHWVMLADERKTATRRTIFATQGRLTTDEVSQTAFLHMLDGTILTDIPGLDSYDKTDFESFELTLHFQEETDASSAPGETPPRQMELGRLLESRQRRLAAHESIVEEEIEIQRKLVVPTATLFMPLLAVPLGIRRSRGGRSRGALASTLIILTYNFSLSGAITLAREGTLEPGVAMWLPNLALAAVSLAIFLRARHDRPLFNLSRLRASN